MTHSDVGGKRMPWLFLRMCCMKGCLGSVRTVQPLVSVSTMLSFFFCEKNLGIQTAANYIPWLENLIRAILSSRSVFSIPFSTFSTFSEAETTILYTLGQGWIDILPCPFTTPPRRRRSLCGKPSQSQEVPGSRETSNGDTTNYTWNIWLMGYTTN